MRDRAATGTVTPADDVVLWAAAEARRLLTPLGNRWVHTCRVATRAWWAAAGLSGHDRELLVAAVSTRPDDICPSRPTGGARLMLGRRGGRWPLGALPAPAVLCADLSHDARGRLRRRWAERARGGR